MQTAWTTLGLAVGLAQAHASSRPAAASATGSTVVASASSSASTLYSVSGTCEGFASSVTGGGDATPKIPADIDELKELLSSDEPQVIVLDKTFNFLGSEGTKTEMGCAPYGTGDMCQQAIDATGTWCSSDYTSVSVTYDVAATEGIEVSSNKTILGVDDKGVLLGKGLRFTNGASNIIVQNIMISDLNPQYVWGGDALTFYGADTVWIDHVTVSACRGQLPTWREQIANTHICTKDPIPRSPALRLWRGCKPQYHPLQQLHQWVHQLLGRMR